MKCETSSLLRSFSKISIHAVENKTNGMVFTNNPETVLNYEKFFN